jgi:hypothetical protein
MTIAEASQHLAPAVVERSDSGELHYCHRLSNRGRPSALRSVASKKNSENNLRVHRTNEKRRSIGAAFILSEGFGRFKPSL